MKKFFAILMTLSLMLSLAVPAMAANEPTTGTIENETGRPYKAYQIFKGTQAEGNEVLGDIEWGTGIHDVDFLAALKTDDSFKVDKANIFENCKTAADVAVALKGVNDNDPIAKAFANLASKHLTNAAFDIENDESTTLASGYYLLIDQKSVAGQNDAKNAALLQITNGAELKIKEKFDVPEVKKEVTNNTDGSDYNIGDEVVFTLTATLPSTFEGYEKYKVIFHDTLSSGLTYKNIASVKVGNEILEANEYTAEHNNGQLTITITDVLVYKPAESSNVVVEYTATLNENAEIGKNGNPNTVYLEYSNDPNATGDGSTGQTPPQEVKVYTWEIPVFKYTGTNTPLAGAGFTLYKVVGETETVVNVVAANNAEGVPAYKVCTKDGCTDHTHATEIVTNAGGKFEIEGLEQGTYVLKETTTPAGYNTCANVTVVIGENGALAQDNTPTTEVGILNNAGATLPETGGMGTTIFYAVGGIMVVAAVVLLVTKKRMSTEG